MARHISAEDANGENKAQYCVKVNQKKTVQAEDYNDTSKVKPNEKQTSFINKYRDKYED